MSASKDRAEADMLRQNAKSVRDRADEFIERSSTASTNGDLDEAKIATDQADKLNQEAAQIEQRAADIALRADDAEKEAKELEKQEQDLRKQADELKRRRHDLTGDGGGLGGFF